MIEGLIQWLVYGNYVPKEGSLAALFLLSNSNGTNSNATNQPGGGSVTYDITGSYNTSTANTTTNYNAMNQALSAQNSPYLVNPTGTGGPGSPILTTNPNYSGPTYPASGIAASGIAGSQYAPYSQQGGTVAPPTSATTMASASVLAPPPVIQSTTNPYAQRKPV